MARSYTKCTGCNDILWFGGTDVAPQATICPCFGTTLKESGPEGTFIDLTQEEIDSLP